MARSVDNGGEQNTKLPFVIYCFDLNFRSMIYPQLLYTKKIIQILFPKKRRERISSSEIVGI